MIFGVLEDLLERPAKQKLAAFGFIMLVVVYADWKWWYGPLQRELAERRTEVIERRGELDGKRSKVNARADAERELRDLDAELKRAEARLPDQREIADLLSSVASSARASGLDIMLFRQKPEVPHDFYADVPVEMQMRGTYHEVTLFLDRVKRLDRIVNIADMRLQKPKLEGEQVALEASCTATTFRFLDETERQKLEAEKKPAGKQQPGGAKKDAGKPA